MSKIRVSAISYTNTIPFIYGLENSSIINHIELTKDIPSECAKKLLENKADIGLVPVAVIPKIHNAEVVSDYCIGASGPARSVILGSNKPMNEIETIYLDYHSRSSVMLARILAKKFWNITVKWADTTEGFENRVNEANAAVVIGDKAFSVEKTFTYKYDLAQEWIKFTGLPFVFAVWASNKPLGQLFKTEFNNALKKGVDSIDKIDKSAFLHLPKHVDAIDYLKNNLSFTLDDNKKKGMELFLKYAAEIN
jgi:chorismate dehydratase